MLCLSRSVWGISSTCTLKTAFFSESQWRANTYLWSLTTKVVLQNLCCKWKWSDCNTNAELQLSKNKFRTGSFSYWLLQTSKCMHIETGSAVKTKRKEALCCRSEWNPPHSYRLTADRARSSYSLMKHTLCVTIKAISNDGLNSIRLEVSGTPSHTPPRWRGKV